LLYFGQTLFSLHINGIKKSWSTSYCAKSVTSTMHAPKFWTSKMWGLGWRSSLWPGMWLCGTRLRPRVSHHDTCLVGLYGVMVEWLLASKRKAKKESMVKILRSSMILNKNSQSCTINRCLRCLAMPHSNFARFLCASKRPNCVCLCHEGIRVVLHSHLVWALDGGKWLSLRPNYFTVRECPRIKLNMRLADQQLLWMFWRREKFFATTGTRTPDRPAYTLVAMPAAIYMLQVK